MERAQFTFYRSFWVAMESLPKRDRLPFIEAVCAYVFEGETRELTGGAAAVFSVVLPVLEASNRKAAGGKLTGSLLQASCKLPASSSQASDKLTENKDKDKNKSKEKDKDKCPPPCPPQEGGARRSRRRSGNVFADMLREEVE